MCCLHARVQKCLPRSLLQPFIVYCLAPCPRITHSRALQLILQLCTLLTPTIEVTCYILRVAICSITNSFRCIFLLYIYQNNSYSAIPVRVSGIAIQQQLFLSGWCLLATLVESCPGSHRALCLPPFSLYAMLMIWQLLLIQGLDYMLMIYYFIELLTLLMTTNFYKMT